MKITLTTAACLMLSLLPAQADITARFIEGAPKDRFVISSADGVCADAPISVTIDLNGSAGKLIFDVTEAGAGVEVFQPFDLVAGGDRVTGISDVADGDAQVTLNLAGLAPAGEVAFTIDVDDTIGAREITVADAEITGATFRVSSGAQTGEARFEGDATARVAWPGCTS
ncbi:MAG: aggregation factor core [Pseudomonadota bacterium]